MQFQNDFNGLIQIYTGNGKGKTTASLGLLLIAYGHGFPIAIIQLMKTEDTGEIKAIKELKIAESYSFGIKGFIDRENPKETDKIEAQKALKKAEELMTSGRFNFLILDEINCAIYFNLIKESDVHELLDKKPSNCEIILTGRCCTESLIKRADLVTEMKEIKHPWKQCGINARKGTEY